jgi:hypothetical protein
MILDTKERERLMPVHFLLAKETVLAFLLSMNTVVFRFLPVSGIHQ